MKNIQKKIGEYQQNVKQKKEGFDIHQNEVREKLDKIEYKIEEEAKLLKQIKSKNDFLQAEYNSTKKDLEQVIIETQKKLKISQDKLDLAKNSVTHFTNQIQKKTELYNDMMNPDMLVRTINKDKDRKNKKTSRKEKIKN